MTIVITRTSMIVIFFLLGIVIPLMISWLSEDGGYCPNFLAGFAVIISWAVCWAIAITLTVVHFIN